MPEVIYLNEKMLMAVIEMEPNPCAVIEILDFAEVFKEDIFIGNFKILGRQTITNKNTYDDINIIVRTTMINPEKAIALAMKL